MKQILTIIAVSCLMIVPATGQDIDQARLETPNAYNSLGVQPAATPFSLLDFSRIKWSHSYSVSFFSGGNQSGSVGLASTSMLYEFSDRLSLQVNLGILHDPGAIWGDKNNNNATLLPGFRLDYRPTDKVFMTLEFQRYDGRAYPYGLNRYNRYWPY